MKKHLSLELFATRFQLPLEDLSYGIAIIGGGYTPVILVRNQPFFIHILEDKIRAKEMPNLYIVLQECELLEQENGVVFENKDVRLPYALDEIEKFCSSLYYSEATKKYVCN